AAEVAVEQVVAGAAGPEVGGAAGPTEDLGERRRNMARRPEAAAGRSRPGACSWAAAARRPAAIGPRRAPATEPAGRGHRPGSRERAAESRESDARPIF